MAALTDIENVMSNDGCNGAPRGHACNADGSNPLSMLFENLVLACGAGSIVSPLDGARTGGAFSRSSTRSSSSALANVASKSAFVVPMPS